jgi:hypothetical protein
MNQAVKVKMTKMTREALPSFETFSLHTRRHELMQFAVGHAFLSSYKTECWA